MSKLVVVQLEHAMCGEQAQHTVQRVGIGADRAREFGRRARGVVERIGDAKLGHHVQAARQHVAGGHLSEQLGGVGLGHGASSASSRR